MEDKLGSQQKTDGFHNGLHQLRRLREDANLRNIILIQRVKSLQISQIASLEIISAGASGGWGQGACPHRKNCPLGGAVARVFS